VLIDLSKGGSLALMVETDFSGAAGLDNQIRGHFFLMPDPRTLEIFLRVVAGEP
jgi:hypothetical protein